NAQRYPATVEQSQHGKHPVLRYTIPGGPLCYTFEHLRTNATYQVYRCTGCRLAVDSRNTMIAIIDNQFVGDPRALPHSCIPAKTAQDKVERLVYKECKKLREVRRGPKTRTRVAWQDMEDHIVDEEGRDEAEKDDMLHYFHRDGFTSRQRTIRRAIRSTEDPSCTMDHIPDRHSQLTDGSRFLQFQNPELHMYYSTKTIGMAQRHGLYALVADGVHDLQPDATNQIGQLYTVHGVCNDTMDVPLLYAITTKKNVRTYELIFAQLKEEMERAGPVRRLRILQWKAARSISHSLGIGRKIRLG
ncbi:unnamed protein product, partial [Cylicostephanus goldi]